MQHKNKRNERKTKRKLTKNVKRIEFQSGKRVRALLLLLFCSKNHSAVEWISLNSKSVSALPFSIDPILFASLAYCSQCTRCTVNGVRMWLLKCYGCKFRANGCFADRINSNSLKTAGRAHAANVEKHGAHRVRPIRWKFINIQYTITARSLAQIDKRTRTHSRLIWLRSFINWAKITRLNAISFEAIQ